MDLNFLPFIKFWDLPNCKIVKGVVNPIGGGRNIH
jgi:hypothetical protein